MEYLLLGMALIALVCACCDPDGFPDLLGGDDK